MNDGLLKLSHRIIDEKKNTNLAFDEWANNQAINDLMMPLIMFYSIYTGVNRTRQFGVGKHIQNIAWTRTHILMIYHIKFKLIIKWLESTHSHKHTTHPIREQSFLYRREWVYFGTRMLFQHCLKFIESISSVTSNEVRCRWSKQRGRLIYIFTVVFLEVKFESVSFVLFCLLIISFF